jgi:hypothetical protein
MGLHRSARLARWPAMAQAPLQRTRDTGGAGTWTLQRTRGVSDVGIWEAPLTTQNETAPTNQASPRPNQANGGGGTGELGPATARGSRLDGGAWLHDGGAWLPAAEYGREPVREAAGCAPCRRCVRG